MKIYQTVILTALLLLSSTFVTAQHSLSGKVSDLDFGEGLAGVKIDDPDGTEYGFTDENGNFEIQILQPKGDLIFSLDGYRSITVSYTGSQKMTVQMQTDAQLLGEVKITAYSDQKQTKKPQALFRC